MHACHTIRAPIPRTDYNMRYKWLSWLERAMLTPGAPVPCGLVILTIRHLPIYLFHVPMRYMLLSLPVVFTKHINAYIINI